MALDLVRRSSSPGADGASPRVMVVSIDSHVAPPLDYYRPYLEQQYLDRFDDFCAAFEERLRTYPGAGSPQYKVDFEPSEQSKEYWRAIEARYNVGGHYDDSQTHLATMDADGISAEVIFHGGLNRIPQPFFSPELGGIYGQHIPSDAEISELRVAGMRAYNRWLADWVSTEPARLFGLAYVPIWDVDEAVAEVRRVRDMGLRGINLPAPKNGLRTYNVTDYDPFWAACVENGITLHTHVATGDPGAADPGPGLFSMRLSELEYASRRHLWHMIFGGVFERHPELKLTLTEQAGNWVKPTLQMLDSVYLAKQQARETPHIRELLPRLPSEYFLSNVYIGASSVARFEVQESIDEGYSNRMMWGSDFPHPEGTWPATRASIRNTFAGFPEDVVRAILAETAVDFLDLDAVALQQVADKMGPTLEEIQRPLEAIPEEAFFSHGFRTVGPYA